MQARVVALADSTLVLVGGSGNSGTLADVLVSTDAGASWRVVVDPAPFGHRTGHSLVVLPQGGLVLTAGCNDTACFDDVWASAPDSRGSRWRRIADGAPWGRRSRHETVVLSNGDIVLVGGYGVTTDELYDDVWRSADGGASWTQVHSGGVFPARGDFGLAVLTNGTVVMAGGSGSSGGLPDQWESNDGGATWFLVSDLLTPVHEMAMVVADNHAFSIGGTDGTALQSFYVASSGARGWNMEAPPWDSRRFAATTALPDGRIVTVGGINTTSQYLADVWVLNRTTVSAWKARDCLVKLPALCRAPLRAVTVAVSLPAAAGSVTPANAASLVAVAAYTPPSVALVPAVEGTATTAAAEAVVDIRFSTPVADLRMEDFHIDVCSGAVASALLSGDGMQWNLAVTVDAAQVHADACPRGFASSAAGGGCAREVTTLGTWEEQRAACHPYPLAVSTSLAQNAFLGSLMSWRFEDYWCVMRVLLCCVCCCAACVLC